MHPYYRFPRSYNDIAISELGRRVMFDFGKYGDSPMCLGRKNGQELIGKTAIVQGKSAILYFFITLTFHTQKRSKSKLFKIARKKP